jgi:hypothetical protein
MPLKVKRQSLEEEFAKQPNRVHRTLHVVIVSLYPMLLLVMRRWRC